MQTVYLSIDDLAEYINLSKSAIYKKTSANQIPFIKTGKKLLFKKEAIDAWLEKYTHMPTQDIDAVSILKSQRNAA